MLSLSLIDIGMWEILCSEWWNYIILDFYQPKSLSHGTEKNHWYRNVSEIYEVLVRNVLSHSDLGVIFIFIYLF